MWLAHRQPLILAVAITVFFTDATVIPMPLVSLALLPIVLTSLLAEGFHQFSLCPRCARNMPLNGPESAQRRSDWLRLHHALRGALWSLVLFAVCFTAVLVWHVPTGVAYVPLYIAWIVEGIANLRHRPLEPWCPQCRRWGWNGDEVGECVVPPPLPAGEK